MLILKPAYGRDYKSQKAVLEDWNSDKDFIIANLTHRYSGKPVNRPQVTEGEQVLFRFNKDRNCLLIKTTAKRNYTFTV